MYVYIYICIYIYIYIYSSLFEVPGQASVQVITVGSSKLLCTYNRWERARERTPTDHEPRRQCHLQVVWRQ